VDVLVEIFKQVKDILELLKLWTNRLNLAHQILWCN
jgi:hypothetical protein